MPRCGPCLPSDPLEWQRAYDTCKKETATADAEDLWASCQYHSLLHHYKPGPYCMTGHPAINRFVHDKSLLDFESRLVARWLCGGQGLRGGDLHRQGKTTQRTACLLCLQHGVRQRESLFHVVMRCPCYAHVRTQQEFAPIIQAGLSSLACIHRDVWSWQGIRSIRRLLCELDRTRRHWILTNMPRKGRLREDKIAELWRASKQQA